MENFIENNGSNSESDYPSTSETSYETTSEKLTKKISDLQLAIGNLKAQFHRDKILRLEDLNTIKDIQRKQSELFICPFHKCLSNDTLKSSSSSSLQYHLEFNRLRMLNQISNISKTDRKPYNQFYRFVLGETESLCKIEMEKIEKCLRNLDRMEDFLEWKESLYEDSKSSIMKSQSTPQYL